MEGTTNSCDGEELATILGPPDWESSDLKSDSSS